MKNARMKWNSHPLDPTDSRYYPHGTADCLHLLLREIGTLNDYTYRDDLALKRED